MNLYDILSLKYPNADFTKDILLSDEGQGVFIRAWNLVGGIPDETTLNLWGSEVDLAYRQKRAVQSRTYPSIGDQLDMQYKDALNNTTIWFDTIAAIKAAHPKPTE